MPYESVNTDDLTDDQRKLLDEQTDVVVETSALAEVSRRLAERLDMALRGAVHAGYDYLHVINVPHDSWEEYAVGERGFQLSHRLIPSDDEQPPTDYGLGHQTYDLRWLTPECLEAIDGDYEQ